MAKIRDLAIWDIGKIKEMVSFLNVEKSMFDDFILPFPFNFFHSPLPVALKFLSEAYVLLGRKNILAYMSVRKEKGNFKKWKFTKIFLTENAQEAGLLLIQYIVSKYAAKGVNTFSVALEDSQKELIHLFLAGANFRHCSHQQIWHIKDLEKSNLPDIKPRLFKNSDSKEVATLFNDNIFAPFRPSLSKQSREYNDNKFSFTKKKIKYVLEDEKGHIIAYFSLKMSDKKTFTLNPVVNIGSEQLYTSIINFSNKLISAKFSDFDLFVLNKYYLQTSQYFENYLKEKNFEMISDYVILVKDLFRTIKLNDKFKSPLFFTDINSTPAFK